MYFFQLHLFILDSVSPIFQLCSKNAERNYFLALFYRFTQLLLMFFWQDSQQNNILIDLKIHSKNRFHCIHLPKLRQKNESNFISHFRNSFVFPLLRLSWSLVIALYRNIFIVVAFSTSNRKSPAHVFDYCKFPCIYLPPPTSYFPNLKAYLFCCSSAIFLLFFCPDSTVKPIWLIWFGPVFRPRQSRKFLDTAMKIKIK